MTDSTAQYSSASGFLSPLTQFGTALLDFFRSLEAARACAAAVENHVAPRADDLRTLGIDPEAFGKVRLM
jgi:hypothetical protein